MTSVGDRAKPPKASRRWSSYALKEGAIFAVCFMLAYPLAGFLYGLRDSDAGWSLNTDLLDGLASGVVMAIQATTSFGFVSLGTIEDIGDGDVLNLYPAILKCAVVLYAIFRIAFLMIGFGYRRRRRRRPS